MNILEFMSFDISWFTTVPGLLITGGVVILLIALIIFISSNKKGGKKDLTKDYGLQAAPTAAPVVPSTATGVVGATEVPIVNAVMPDAVVPTVEVAPAVVPATDTPIMEISPAPEVVMPIPAVEPVPVVEAPMVAEIPVAQSVEEPTIYGGTNPVSAVPTIEQQAPVIYGGANPLENTSTIPTVNINQVPSAPAMPEPAVTMPVVPPVVETPAAPQAPTAVPTINNATEDVVETLDF